MTCFVRVSGGHGLDVWKPITHEGPSLTFTPSSVQDGAAGGDLQQRIYRGIVGLVKNRFGGHPFGQRSHELCLRTSISIINMSGGRVDPK